MGFELESLPDRKCGVMEEERSDAVEASQDSGGQEMAAPLPVLPVSWFEASGISETASMFERRVLKTAGDFLSRVGRISEDEIAALLADIDFSSALTVVPLPQSVFVREPFQSACWYTDTGLSVETVRTLPGARREKLYSPVSVIPALKCRSKTQSSVWAVDRLFPAVSPQTVRQMCLNGLTGGGQYLVFQHQSLREL